MQRVLELRPLVQISVQCFLGANEIHVIVHKEKVPKALGYPGSTVSRDNGCRCQPLRNFQGAGIPTDFGVVFVTNPDCLLHGIDAMFPIAKRDS